MFDTIRKAARTFRSLGGFARSTLAMVSNHAPQGIQQKLSMPSKPPPVPPSNPFSPRVDTSNAQDAAHADERSIRRLAEQQDGGLSSEESRKRYQNGENPGGLHHKAVRQESPSLFDEDAFRAHPHREHGLSESRKGN